MNKKQIAEEVKVSKISKVWEDNEAALKHAVTDMPKLSPQTKHIGIKYHFFRDKISKETNKKGLVNIMKLDT